MLRRVQGLTERCMNRLGKTIGGITIAYCSVNTDVIFSLFVLAPCLIEKIGSKCLNEYSI